MSGEFPILSKMYIDLKTKKGKNFKNLSTVKT